MPVKVLREFGMKENALVAEEKTCRPGRCILVIEEDAQIRALLRETLEMEGYRVCGFASGRQWGAILDKERVDLITVGLELGGEDGLALVREIRTTRDVPIIIISAKAAHVDRVVGLELGADDYITKPFYVREVLARVRAVLRRYEAPARREAVTLSGNVERFRFDGWILDTSARELRQLTGQTVELTTAEFDLLDVFVHRPGRVLTRNALMDALKGHEWSPLDRTIDALVSRLRKKVEADQQNPSLIKTVRGVGYVFAMPVTRA